MEGQSGRAAARQKSVEIVVAALFCALGALVIFDSVRLGSSWGADGPRPGYFPFYVGLIMTLSAAITLVRALLPGTDGKKAFVEKEQLKAVLAVLVPSALYVLLVTWIGIYVASIAFIAFFMRWLGKYRWWQVITVSVATMVVFFLIFELWFKVPLPKGPLEAFLGLD